MEDTLYFIGLILIGAILVGFGLPIVSGGDLTANPSQFFGLLGSAFAAVDVDWSPNIGQFLITFDDFKNSHKEVLDSSFKLKIFDVNGQLERNIIWAGTDHGLFLSQDGGLTWNRFVSSNNEINQNSLVFKIIPASKTGWDYFVSVFSEGKGVVYETNDSFFDLKKLIDFDGEAAYDIYYQGKYLYFAMSTGQIIRYNLANQESRVVNVFKSPVVKIYYPKDGYFYVLLKNGKLAKSTSLDGEFRTVSIPGSWLFGSTPVRNVVFDLGDIYILTQKGVYVSYNGGETFILLKHIPLTKNQIDALGVYRGTIYIVSGKRLYVSKDGGENWTIVYLNNEFKPFQFYFLGSRTILSM
jgi:hypothetical protein